MSAATRRKWRREQKRDLAGMIFAAGATNGLIYAAAGASETTEWLEAAGEDGKPKLKKFTGIAYTGGLMAVGMGRPVVIELAGLSAGSDVIPFLKDHEPTQIVGHGSADIGKAKIKVTGVVSGNGDAATEVVGLAGNGFPWQMSVGVAPSKMDFLDAGETKLVNGKNVSGPAYIVRAGQLREVSFVAIGADGRTSSAIAASFQGVGEMGFDAWVAAKGFEVDKLTESQRTTLRAAYDAEIAAAANKGTNTPPPKPESNPPATGGTVNGGTVNAADVERIVATAVQAAVGAVNESAAIANVFATFDKTISAEKLATIRATANAEKWNRDRVELECRRESRPVAPAIHCGDPSAVNAAAIEVGLLRAQGVPAAYIERTFKPEVLAAADSKRYRGMSLHKALGLVCQAAGVYAAPGDKEGLVEAAFKAHQELMKFDAFSTMSLSGILGNTANKAMLASYGAAETTWQKIAAVRSHSDFKINTLYRMDATGAFKKVGATGELKLSALEETSFTKQLATYGTIMALTRRDMVNDDMGAFLGIAGELGRMAAIRIEEAVYVLLLSNPSSFFAAGNGNYQTGAGALAIGTLTTLAQKFADQVDANGKPVLLSPKTLLVGSALKTTAENLYNETIVIATTTANAPLPARNPLAGLYEPVSSPYVNNTRIKDQDGGAISGQTSTGFGLFADPAVRAAMGVAFLNGAQTPTIQSSEMDFAQLGMQWRGFIDFGVGMEDVAAAAWSTGT